MKRTACLVLTVTLLAACGERRDVTAPIGYAPNALISDGAKAGNVDFFFLPPLVADPRTDGDFDADAFDGSQSPEVRICEWSGSACVADVAQFTMTSGAGSETVRVVPTDELYIVNWHTDLSDLQASKTYRIGVLVNGVPVGFADVDVLDRPTELKSVQTGDFIGLVDGRTLPIKFRLERGIQSGDCADCARQVVGSGGGTVVTNLGGAGVFIPPGALDDGEEVLVTIGPAAQPCVPADVPQFDACFEFHTDPPVRDRPNGGFNTNVTVAVCVDVPAEMTHEQAEALQLYQFDPEDLERGVRVLPNASASFLPCEEARFPEPSPIGLVRGLLNRFASVLGPRALYATTAVVDQGVGGSTDAFSHIGWGRPVYMTLVEGTSGESAPAGDPVENPPAVLVRDRGPEGGDPVPGVSVHFVVTGPNGTIEPRDGLAVTGADGIARLGSWVLGAGENTVEARGLGLEATPRTVGRLETGVIAFTATGVVPVTLIDCQTSVSADFIDRGFYVEEFPGTRLDRVTLYVSARTSGTYTFSLTARSGTYDGTVLGTATATITLTADEASVATIFTFPSPAVPEGSTVTFAIGQVAGPSEAQVFYDIPAFTGSTCPVIQTEGTTPPLDTFRRQGIRVKIEGGGTIIG